MNPVSVPFYRRVEDALGKTRMRHAVRHTSPEGFEQHGFLNVLLATVRAFDGASRAETVATLEERDAGRLAATDDDVARARRWFTSFGTCSIDEPLADLLALDLIPRDPTEQSR